jgi:hypothetical protein
MLVSFKLSVEIKSNMLSVVMLNAVEGTPYCNNDCKILAKSFANISLCSSCTHCVLCDFLPIVLTFMRRLAFWSTRHFVRKQKYVSMIGVEFMKGLISYL